MNKVLKFLGYSLILSVVLFINLFVMTTLNDNPSEKLCEGAFSDGRWNGYDIWNIAFPSKFVGNFYFMNCECGPFGQPYNKDNNPREASCNYNLVVFNETQCKENQMRWDGNFRPTSNSVGTCFCDLGSTIQFDNRAKNHVACVPEDTYKEYLEDRHMGWYKFQIIGNVISFIGLFVFSMILISLVYLFYFLIRKKK